LDQSFSDHVAGMINVTFHEGNSAVYNLGVVFIF